MRANACPTGRHEKCRARTPCPFEEGATPWDLGVGGELAGEEVVESKRAKDTWPLKDQKGGTRHHDQKGATHCSQSIVVPTHRLGLLPSRGQPVFILRPIERARRRPGELQSRCNMPTRSEANVCPELISILATRFLQFSLH